MVKKKYSKSCSRGGFPVVDLLGEQRISKNHPLSKSKRCALLVDIALNWPLFLLTPPFLCAGMISGSLL
jgi:hypothetical protein